MKPSVPEEAPDTIRITSAIGRSIHKENNLCRTAEYPSHSSKEEPGRWWRLLIMGSPELKPHDNMLDALGGKNLSWVMLLEFHKEARMLLPKTDPGYSTDNSTFICYRIMLMNCLYDLSSYNLCVRKINVFMLPSYQKTVN